jgi:hypothetical protein
LEVLHAKNTTSVYSSCDLACFPGFQLYVLKDIDADGTVLKNTLKVECEVKSPLPNKEGVL